MSDAANNDAKVGSQSKSGAASGTKTLAQALKRLNDAIDILEEKSASVNPSDRDQELQRMADDRSRLGRDLDASEARAARLKEVNSDVSRRLVKAMEMVRGVLENKG